MSATDNKASGMDQVMNLIGNMLPPQSTEQAEPQSPVVQPTGPAYAVPATAEKAPAKPETAPAAPAQDSRRSSRSRDRRKEERPSADRETETVKAEPPAIEPESPASEPEPAGADAALADAERETQPAGVTDDVPSDAKAGRNPKKRRATEPSEQVDKGKRTARSVYIPADVTKLLAIARIALRRSYTDITLEAVNSHYKNAATLPDQAGGGGRMTGGLFPREIAPKKSKKGLESIYLSDAETKILDTVAQEAGLRSRSDLVSRCLRAYLSRMVFTTMETVLDLQDSGTPEAVLRERIESLVSDQSDPRPLPDDNEEWIVAPSWILGMSKVLEQAQRELDLGSWSEVVWAAMEPASIR